MNEIEMKSNGIQEELESLPQSFADNPQGKLLNLCAEFTSSVRDYTSGTPAHLRFFQYLHDEFWKLAQEITLTRPNFHITEQKSTQSLGKVASAYKDSVAAWYRRTPPTPGPTESVTVKQSAGKTEQSKGREPLPRQAWLTYCYHPPIGEGYNSTKVYS